MSAKSQAYVEALLKNHEFIKVAADRYGSGLANKGNGNFVAQISMVQLANAIHGLETALLDLEPRGENG